MTSIKNKTMCSLLKWLRKRNVTFDSRDLATLLFSSIKTISTYFSVCKTLNNMTLSDYSHLKQQIVISVGSNDRHNRLLGTLKDLFRGEINSPRRFEQIDTVGQLLHVLEIRDVLSEDNVAPLKQISQRLSNSGDLMTKIIQYEKSYVPRVYGNYYEMQNRSNQMNSRRPIVENCGNLIHNNYLSPKKQQRIIQTVVEEIGNSWRDLARNLSVRECVINDIDHNHKTLARKALCLMEVYLEHKAEPDKWVFVLCDALDNTRRKDLTRAIRKIQMMNI